MMALPEGRISSLVGDEVSREATQCKDLLERAYKRYSLNELESATEMFVEVSARMHNAAVYAQIHYHEARGAPRELIAMYRGLLKNIPVAPN